MLRLPARCSKVDRLLHRCQSSWTGCDWDAELGGRMLNLQGLRSRQAWMAAQATRGSESGFWHNVYLYLTKVEQDAQQAGIIATEAVENWQAGGVATSLRLIDSAIAIEACYRAPLVYPKLRCLLSKPRGPQEDSPESLFPEPERFFSATVSKTVAGSQLSANESNLQRISKKKNF